MFEYLQEKFPSVNPQHLSALAEIWSEEINLVLNRMLTISREECGPGLPIEVRHEAIFEVAKLTLWLEGRLLEVKTASTKIEDIDPNEERQNLDTPKCKERIENTARICADSIWKKLVEKWHKEHPLIISTEKAPHRKKLITGNNSPGVQNQHYTPVFSNKYWATGPQNKVRVYSLGVDHQVTARDVGYKSWGYATFLYSQSLEHYLGLVEGDAKTSYDNLLDIIPLGEHDRRCWVAFLIVQLFRTPAFIAKNLPALKAVIESKGIEYPSDIASLRRAYETLFTNNDVFASYYKTLTGLKWKLLTAPPGSQFIRADEPILTQGSINTKTWKLVYPMTPSKCFVVGPEAADPFVVVPENQKIDEATINRMNESLAKVARKTVIAQPSNGDSKLRAVLQPSLGARWSQRNWLLGEYEYWQGLNR
jgi:hypothetical protein